ncbi:hypothetical protein [Spongiibacter tropicus]|uniref:hypothetical protein n=1 Tax=Spongiibacter tropicus TaxID=454602 RepID=UPI0035BE827E
MDFEKENPGVGASGVQAESGTTNTTTCNASKKRKPGKLLRMLELFASGKRLHRFQAEAYGDHVLNSTVSDLQRRHRLYFYREFVKVPNRFGTPTYLAEHHLEGQGLARTCSIVSGLRERQHGQFSFRKSFGAL